MNGTYSPIPGADGFAVFTEGGESGWHQLDMPGAELPTLSGLAVPADAQGYIIQALTDVRYCWSPSHALSGASSSMLLPAGSSITVPGQNWLRSFCILLGAGTASFAIQYTTGSIGPLPLINAPGGGGGTPPPPPGLLSVPTNNVVHVMKNGNDATGLRNRLDKPFLTITAGKAVLQPGDTMCIWPGTYNEGGINVKNVTYKLLGCSIVGQSTGSAGATFRFTGSGNVSIEGSGTISHLGSTTQLTYCVRAEGGTGEVELDGPAIVIGGGTLVHCQDNWRGNFKAPVFRQTIETIGQFPAIFGNTTTFGNIEAKGVALVSNTLQVHYGNVVSGNTGLNCTGGVQTVHGDVNAAYGAICVDGVQTVHGNLTVAGTYAHQNGARCVSGSQTIHGNIVTDIGCGALCNTGTQIINGTVTSNGPLDTHHGARCNTGGFQRIDGSCISQFASAAYCDGGEQLVYGNCETQANDFVSAAAYCNSGVQAVYGSARASQTAIGAKCVAGNQSVKGGTSSFAGAAAQCLGGFQTIDGLSTGPLAITCNGGEMHVFGQVEGALFIAQVDAGHLHLYANCTGPDIMAQVGALTIYGRVELSTGQLYVEDGAELHLAATAVVVSQDPGFANAITGDAGAVVKNLGAWSNKPVDPLLTVLGTPVNVGTFL